MTALVQQGAVGVQADPASVPNAAHYRSRYLGKDAIRLFSYRAQISHALGFSPQSALIIGKGDGLVARLLADYGVGVTTLDIAADLNPDLVASVLSIPADAGRFDVTLCCQVLEHLPFDQFGAALREIRRVTTAGLVLSLPDIRRFISLRLSGGPVRLDWQLSVPRFPVPTLPAERLDRHGHHWEIGFRGTSFRAVRDQVLDSGWKISQVRRVSDLPWHTFVICQPG